MDQLTIVGRVLRSSTTSFTVGCRQLISEQDQRIPEFGGRWCGPKAKMAAVSTD